MFLKCVADYDRHGQQRARGPFLMIADDPSNRDSRKLRAFVRSVRMDQCGHWMMGLVRISTPRGIVEFILSGSYGSDGLPMHLNHERDGEYTWFWDYMHDVPQELQDAFWAGGGHNTAGKEGPLLRKWALENIRQLRLLRRQEDQDGSQGASAVDGDVQATGLD